MDLNENPIFKCSFAKNICERVVDLHNDMIIHENAVKECQICAENTSILSIIKNHLFSIVKINLCLKNDEEFVEYLEEADRHDEKLFTEYGEPFENFGFDMSDKDKDCNNFPEIGSAIPEVEFDEAFMDEDSSSASSRSSSPDNFRQINADTINTESTESMSGISSVEDRNSDKNEGDCYTCDICQERIFTKPKLIDHMETHKKQRIVKDKIKKTPEVYEKCVLCKIMFSGRHQCSFGKGSFRCIFCSSQHRSYYSLYKHHKIYHDEHPLPESPFQCQFCEKSATKASLLVKHMRIHAAVPRFKCEKCGKAFQLLRDKRTHMWEHVPKEELLQCDVCQKKFFFTDSLRTHVKTMHPHHKQVEFFHPCAICGQKFKTVSGLRKHKQNHRANERPYPYKCEICERRFMQKNMCDKHRKILHAPTKPRNQSRYSNFKKQEPIDAAKKDKPVIKSPTRASRSSMKDNTRNGQGLNPKTLRKRK
ncbi:Zinc finger C2H2 superfamily [Sergentomyia squamirostris]